MTDPASGLRSRNAPGAGRVSFSELFFDLVFVFAVTQLSHLISVHPDFNHAAQAGLLLLALWTLWMWTTWAMNWIEPDQTPARLMLFVMMGLGLILSAAIPDAFGAHGLVFAIAYVAMQNGRNLFLLWALRAGAANERRNFLRVQGWLLISSALWIVGALQEGATRWALWGAAVFCETFSPWWNLWFPGLGASSSKDWRVDCHHMAERCGLFLIIALGESIVVSGARFAGGAWQGVHVAALLIAVASAAAMWWIYFAGTYEEALDEFRAHADPGRLAREAYTYAHIPMIAGVIVSAVGAGLSLDDPLAPATPPARLIIAGGPALFLFGSAWFNRVFCGGVSKSHSAGLAALAAVGAGSTNAPALGLAIACAAILIAVALAESRRARENVNERKPLPPTAS